MSKQVTTFLLLCLTVACRPAEPPPSTNATTPDEPVTTSVSPSPREIALGIDASKSELRSESKKGKAGELDVSETRFFVGSALVLVEEIVGAPDTGHSFGAYYFDDDRLVYFRGRGLRTIFIPGGAETRENFDIELGYDVEGNVVDSKKIIDGAPATLEPLDYEVPKVKASRLLDN